MSTNNILNQVNSYFQQQYEEAAMKIFKMPYAECGIGYQSIVREYVKDCNAPEEWRPVVYKGLETNYEISNFANIRNTTTGTDGLAQKTNRDGYKMVNLSIKGTLCTTTVHRLVMTAFAPNVENKPVINHINGEKDFNWVGNLEWVTYAENTQHAIATGLKPAFGIDNSNNKFSEEEIRHVCKLLETNEATAVSRMPGVTVSLTVISGIKQGRIWTHISKDFNIPAPVNIERPAELKEKLISVIQAGGLIDEMLNATGLENNPHERNYVALFRRRYLKANPEYAPKK